MARGTLLAFLLLVPSSQCWGQVAPTGSPVDGIPNTANASVLDSITPLADSATPAEEESPQPWKLFQTQNINIGGWSQTGYHSRSDGMFNNSPDRIRQHQTWFFAEKVADGTCGTGLGFRVDYVYGTDGPDTQAFGNPAGVWDEAWDNGNFYGHAIPQLYGEVARGDVSIKVGRFFTPVGFEVVPATGNFFYSHAFTM